MNKMIWNVIDLVAYFPWCTELHHGNGSRVIAVHIMLTEKCHLFFMCSQQCLFLNLSMIKVFMKIDEYVSTHRMIGLLCFFWGSGADSCYRCIVQSYAAGIIKVWNITDTVNGNPVNGKHHGSFNLWCSQMQVFLRNEGLGIL